MPRPQPQPVTRPAGVAVMERAMKSVGGSGKLASKKLILQGGRAKNTLRGPPKVGGVLKKQHAKKVIQLRHLPPLLRRKRLLDPNKKMRNKMHIKVPK